MTKVSPYLPDELLYDILSFIPDRPQHQADIHAFSLVCRQWYHVAIARLYRRPYITQKNFDRFVRTLCPSVIIHVKKTDLSSLVQVLDLSALVYQSTKSLTARLLGRTKLNLEVFLAPQASFGITSFAALAKCKQLKTLDLTLVFEAIPYATLSQTLTKLPNLESLWFPRTSAVRDDNFDAKDMRWPPRLRELHLAGGLSTRFISGLTVGAANFPSTLTSLSLTNSPILEPIPALQLLAVIGTQLRQLTICMLPRMSVGTFNPVFLLCPNLEKLSISSEYLSKEITNILDSNCTGTLPLRELRVTASQHPSPHDNRVEPLDIEYAVEKGWLQNLRRVVVSKSTGWLSNEFDLRDELMDLGIHIGDLCKKDFEAKRGEYEGRSETDKFDYPDVILVDDSDVGASEAGFDW